LCARSAGARCCSTSASLISLEAAFLTRRAAAGWVDIVAAALLVGLGRSRGCGDRGSALPIPFLGEIRSHPAAEKRPQQRLHRHSVWIDIQGRPQSVLIGRATGLGSASSPSKQPGPGRSKPVNVADEPDSIAARADLVGAEPERGKPNGCQLKCRQSVKKISADPKELPCVPQVY
jgi:hypothetical protein